MCLTAAHVHVRVETATEEVDADAAHRSTVHVAAAESVPVAADAAAVTLFRSFHDTVAALRMRG